MQAAVARIKMQLEKLRDELTILENEVKTLEREAKKTSVSKYDDGFSRDKEDFIAP